MEPMIAAIDMGGTKVRSAMSMRTGESCRRGNLKLALSASMKGPLEGLST